MLVPAVTGKFTVLKSWADPSRKDAGENRDKSRMKSSHIFFLPPPPPPPSLSIVSVTLPFKD